MKGFVCSVCGYISIDGAAPEKCPVCGVTREKFQEKADAIVEPSKQTEKLEANKKHIPQITVNKQCKLIPGACAVDVNMKVGEITHPMLPEHFIMYIDCYIDKKFISRIQLTPENMNPAVGLHLKISNGRFSAVEKCNIHGAWISEVDL
jgi:superoxide reductase